MTLKDAFKTLFDWLDSERKKPLLVHGPLQSGKKTIIRNGLKKKGYIVIEPKDEKSLDNHYDYDFRGKPAYLMRTEDVKLKPLPRVKKAPVIYVCYDPYSFGLTQAELMSKFEMVKFETGFDFTVNEGLKDEVPTYWEAVRKIRNERSFVGQLFCADQTADYFPTVINNSYIKAVDTWAFKNPKREDRNTQLEMARLLRMTAQSADSFSDADLFDSLDANSKFQMDHYRLAFRTIFPIKYSDITPKDIEMKKPKPTPSFVETNPFLSFKMLYPKNSQPVPYVAPTEAKPQHEKAKRGRKRKDPTAPAKPRTKKKKGDAPVKVQSIKAFEL